MGDDKRGAAHKERPESDRRRQKARSGRGRPSRAAARARRRVASTSGEQGPLETQRPARPRRARGGQLGALGPRSARFHIGTATLRARAPSAPARPPAPASRRGRSAGRTPPVVSSPRPKLPSPLPLTPPAPEPRAHARRGDGIRGDGHGRTSESVGDFELQCVAAPADAQATGIARGRRAAGLAAVACRGVRARRPPRSLVRALPCGGAARSGKRVRCADRCLRAARGPSRTLRRSRDLAHGAGEGGWEGAGGGGPGARPGARPPAGAMEAARQARAPREGARGEEGGPKGPKGSAAAQARRARRSAHPLFPLSRSVAARAVL